MQIWRRVGLVYTPSGDLWWSKTHASVPTVVTKQDKRVGVIFNTRDQDNHTRPAYLEMIIEDDYYRVIEIRRRPLLELGAVGLFDDSGIWIQSIVELENKWGYFYYNGWHKGVTVPYYTFVGMAEGSINKLVLRKRRAPILDRNEIDPYGTSGPWVFRESRNYWRMYYISIVDYRPYDGKYTYYYHIKYAESEDGINWDRKGIVAIDFKYPGETRIARPVVIKEDGMYKMWYCYAIGHGGYRIGYAESEDGVNWVRKDNELRFIGERGEWEREMMAYPYVFEHHGRKYMLYNGNGYGRTGFGLAVLEE